MGKKEKVKFNVTHEDGTRTVEEYELDLSTPWGAVIIFVIVQILSFGIIGWALWYGYNGGTIGSPINLVVALAGASMLFTLSILVKVLYEHHTGIIT